MCLRNRLARTPPNNRRKTGNEGSHPIGGRLSSVYKRRHAPRFAARRGTLLFGLAETFRSRSRDFPFE